MNDNIFFIFGPSFTGHFYDAAGTITQKFKTKFRPSIIYRSSYSVSDEMIFHNLFSFTFFDFMDDMGGFLESLMISFGIMIHFINKHDFEI